MRMLRSDAQHKTIQNCCGSGLHCFCNTYPPHRYTGAALRNSLKGSAVLSAACCQHQASGRQLSFARRHVANARQLDISQSPALSRQTDRSTHEPGRCTTAPARLFLSLRYYCDDTRVSCRSQAASATAEVFRVADHNACATSRTSHTQQITREEANKNLELRLISSCLAFATHMRVCACVGVITTQTRHPELRAPLIGFCNTRAQVRSKKGRL